MLNLDMLSARREVGARLPVEDEHENDEEDDFRRGQYYFFKYFCGLAANVFRLASEPK